MENPSSDNLKLPEISDIMSPNGKSGSIMQIALTRTSIVMQFKQINTTQANIEKYHVEMGGILNPLLLISQFH